MTKRKKKVTKVGEGSLCVHFPIPADVAKGMMFDGGEAPETMHLTLAYMGKNATLPDDAHDLAVTACSKVAEEFGPVDGTIGGIGRFNASGTSDGSDVFYATYDSPLLPALRQAVVQEIEKTGLKVKQEHGYTPHVTLQYLPQESDLPTHKIPSKAITFPSIMVSSGKIGIEGKHTIVPLKGSRIQKAAPPAVALSPDQILAMEIMGLKMVAKQAPGRRVKIVKMDNARRLVYGIVLRPNEIDLQGHIMTPEDVEYACHHYSGVKGIMGDRHSDVADACCVESYIAPVDFEMGGQQVMAGDWILVSYVASDDIWAKCESGEYAGYSVGGFGLLTPLV